MTAAYRAQVAHYSLVTCTCTVTFCIHLRLASEPYTYMYVGFCMCH